VLITPVLVLPLAFWVPLQLPLAVHDVGLLVADQLIVALLPVPIEVGLTLMVTTGAAVGPEVLTVRVALADPLPPALLQDRL